MSDERTSTGPGAPVHFEHWCETPGCSKWGGLGFAASKNAEIRWWCFEHYPYPIGGGDGSANTGAVAKEIADNLQLPSIVVADSTP